MATRHQSSDLKNSQEWCTWGVNSPLQLRALDNAIARVEAVANCAFNLLEECII